MKAVIVATASNRLLGTLLGPQGAPDLTALLLALETFPLDEIFITGAPALASPVTGWFEKERARFRVPVTLRFHEDFGDPLTTGPLMRFVAREDLHDSVLLVNSGEGVSFDSPALRKTISLHPHSPVIGVRKAHRTRCSLPLGEGNRMTRFAPHGRRRAGGWELAGAHYFPVSFLSDSLPAFEKSPSANGRGFDAFLSWSARNFKLYTHVFAAPSGL